MRRALLRIGFAALGVVPNLVLAQATCPAGTVPFPATGQTVTMLLTGNTMCAARGSDRWQEFHQAGGDLVDFKLGPGHPVDPQKKVGTWTSDNAASTVTHNYGTNVVTWLVCKPPTAVSPVTLVSTGTAGTVTNVGMQRGQGKCP